VTGPVVLAINPGSRSLKLAVHDSSGVRVFDLQVLRPTADAAGALRDVAAGLATAGVTPSAVAHRVVHGGPLHVQPERIDDDLLASLRTLVDFAPLHLPGDLDSIDAARVRWPDLPHVACFDTAFHATLPPAAATYALPAEWNARWRLRRYGFHGLSHGYAVQCAADLLGRPLDALRVVSCHLGAGASLCAVAGGRSVDTTMGFTPLAGLVMVTRSGSVDPGLVLWLQEHGGLSREEVSDALEHRSGLAGLSGTSGDLRDVLAAAGRGDAAAALAYDVFVHRLAREAAAMTVATAGLDLLVLTGGIGEHSPEVRRDLAARLAHLGVEVDDRLNAARPADADVAPAGARVRTVVVTAREDLQVAREVADVLARPT
jgi:acetate kinase